MEAGDWNRWANQRAFVNDASKVRDKRDQTFNRMGDEGEGEREERGEEDREDGEEEREEEENKWHTPICVNRFFFQKILL